MGFMDAVRSCLSKYATISGRARRAEYWYFYLAIIIAAIIAATLDVVVGVITFGLGAGIFSIIVTLGIIIPSICVTIRRLHDQDRSGWWILIALVPAIGGIVLLVFMILRGTEGDNRFGPDPLAGEY